jgi:hypothetical protein
MGPAVVDTLARPGRHCQGGRPIASANWYAVERPPQPRLKVLQSGGRQGTTETLPIPTPPTPRSSESLTRAEYFAERELLLDARQRSYQRAEQMVTGGAIGALVLSITFLEKLVPARLVQQPRALIAAWVCLLASLGISLSSQYISAQAFDCEIRRLESRLHDERMPPNRWATCNHAFGWLSAGLLLTGIALLARFAYVNAPFHP